jgi:hypothetical protein
MLENRTKEPHHNCLEYDLQMIISLIGMFIPNPKSALYLKQNTKRFSLPAFYDQ